MKKGIKVMGIFVAVIAVIIIGGMLVIGSQAKKAFSSLSYETVDMSKAQDGTYEGEADAGLVYARVRVTVKNQAIETIEILKHKNGMGKKAEAIVDSMVTANSYAVDAVSGATLSSQTIKSAVSKALLKSMNE